MGRALDGRVALITGAGSCIGRTSALAFARAGARVVLSDVSVEEGRETLRVIEEVCGDGLFIEGDVSIPADAQTVVRTAVEEYGHLDCAHNHVGIEGVRTPAAEGAEVRWDRMLAVNMRRAYLSMKHEIRQMLEQGGGSIVNTTSVTGLIGFPGICARYASEGGVSLLTRGAALEYAKKGIRVNAVCPGFVRSPMMDDLDGLGDPLGQMATPEGIAEAVVWLCSDAASFVTGHAMVVAGTAARRSRAAFAMGPLPPIPAWTR